MSAEVMVQVLQQDWMHTAVLSWQSMSAVHHCCYATQLLCCS